MADGDSDAIKAELDQAADQLYAATREQFIPLRKELAKAAKAAGDRDAAAAIDKLAKPTLAAWLANQLARVNDDEVGELIDLGTALREAHERLDGAELRSLTQRRTELIAQLVRSAAAVHGQQPGEPVVRELEEILSTAVADPDAALVLAAGRLTSARGLGGPPSWPALPMGSGSAGRPARPKPAADGAGPAADSSAESSRKDDRLQRAREDLDHAHAAVKQSESARAEQERALRAAEQDAEQAAAEVRRITDELERAQGKEWEARRRISTARKAVTEAERAAGRAWREVQQAERRLTALSAD